MHLFSLIINLYNIKINFCDRIKKKELSMKIEMGESLMQSWLKHAKECKITQLNWKPSANWTAYNEQSIEELYKRISTHFPVFKNNTNYV